jgi:glyoxylase-like metal-dependent hydrolase (beta-lactamase superfamily II)
MINKIKENIFQFYFNKFGSCVYLIKHKSGIILVDTSTKDNRKEIIKDLKQISLTPSDIKIILLTHRHWDHTGNLDLFNARVYDSENIDKLKKQENIQDIQIIRVPGHTYDSLAFLYKRVLFSGDTLFVQGIGRTDLPESQPEKMKKSLEKLSEQNYDILCPGHM